MGRKHGSDDSHTGSSFPKKISVWERYDSPLPSPPLSFLHSHIEDIYVPTTDELNQMLPTPRLHRLARRIGVAQEVHVRLHNLLHVRGFADGETRGHLHEAGLALLGAGVPRVPQSRVDDARLDGVDAHGGEVEG